MNKLSDTISIPVRIAAIYAVTAGLWILFSDKLLGYLVTNRAMFMRLSIFKGWAFVIITAAILWWLIRRNLLLVLRRDQKLREEH